MKVALFNDSFPPFVDGVARVVLNYAEILNRQYAEATVVTPKYPGVTDEYSFDVFRFQSANLGEKLGYRIGNPFSPLAVGELVKKKFDILHVHCPFSSAVLAREVQLASKKRPPMVFTYHTKYDIDLDNVFENDFFENIAVKFISKNIGHADEVWAVSNGAIDSLRKFGYEGNVRVMPNGTDFKIGKADDSKINELRNRLSISDDCLNLLFCGRMMWYKNIKLIIDALALLQNDGLKFKMIFVGDGADISGIKDYCSEKLSNSAFVFAGLISDREELRTYFSVSDLFLFPSTFDTSGLVVKEAAACGCPSLLVKNSCAAEGTEDLRNALISLEDSFDIYEKLKSVCGKKDFLKKLGENAQKELYYSWDDAVKDAYERYSEIIELAASAE